MNNTKKYCIIFLVIFLILNLVGCSSGNNDNEKIEADNQTKEEVLEEAPKEIEEDVKSENKEILTFGDKFEFDGFNITLGEEYYVEQLKNQFSEYDGDPVIEVPVNIENISGETQAFNLFYFTIFNQNGNESEDLSFYFDNSIGLSGDLRDGANLDTYFHIHYTGDGDYYIEFDNFSETIEVKLPISI